MSASFDHEGFVAIDLNDKAQMTYIETLFDIITDEQEAAIKASIESKRAYKKFIWVKTIMFPLEWTLAFIFFGRKEAKASFVLLKEIRANKEEETK